MGIRLFDSVHCTTATPLLLLSAHSLDPCFRGESNHSAFGPPASISLHPASSSITPAGSKLGRHTSSSETQLVTRETKRKSLEMAQTFTTDLVRRAIKSCRNSKAFGPDKLSIFHLKHLGPRVIEYITSLDK